MERLLERVCRKHHDAFVRFASRRCGADDDEAEDPVQDMYCQFPNLLVKGGFDPEGSVDMTALGRYLYGVLRKHVANGRRTAARRRKLLDERGLPESSFDSVRRWIARLECEGILAQLAPHDAQLLRWRYRDGLTNREVGEILGIRTGTVEVRVHRALKRAREIVGL